MMTKCKWCDERTNNTDFQCNNCWEMLTRIERDPKLAIKMLRRLGVLTNAKEALIQLSRCIDGIDCFIDFEDMHDFGVLVTKIEELVEVHLK